MPEFCDCKHESKIAILEQRDQMIVEALQKMDGKVDLILMQVTKVAVLEVNHSNHNEALGRAFSRIETLEKDNAALAKEAREFINEVKGMAKMGYWVWGLMGTGLGAMLVKVLFFFPAVSGGN